MANQTRPNEHSELKQQLTALQAENTPEWWIEPWIDGRGKVTDSWDIRCGPKNVPRSVNNIVCADLTQLEASEIAEKHNFVLAALNAARVTCR